MFGTVCPALPMKLFSISHSLTNSLLNCFQIGLKFFFFPPSFLKVQLFKAVDLRDGRTPINFTLAVVNKNFHLGKRVTFTPSVGFLLEQFESKADHGSDAVVIVTTAFNVSPHLTLEHSTLAGNLLLEPEIKDWVNRLRLIYSINHVDITLIGWHNNAVFDSSEYITIGASIFCSRLKVSKVTSLNAGITGLYMPHTSNEIAAPVMNGAFLTIGCAIH